MLDVNCPWSLREALDMAEQLRPYNLRWLEEPVWPPENYAGLAHIRASAGIPIAAGENAATLLHYQQMFEAQAVDFAQPSPTKMGGISELRKVFALAAANNVTVMPHSFYDGPGLLAALHVNAALGGARWWSGATSISKRGSTATKACRRTARSRCRQGPGLGFDPDPEVIERYRVS